MRAIVKGSPFLSKISKKTPIFYKWERFKKAKRRGVLDENPKKSAWRCKYN